MIRDDYVSINKYQCLGISVNLEVSEYKYNLNKGIECHKLKSSNPLIFVGVNL